MGKKPRNYEASTDFMPEGTLLNQDIEGSPKSDNDPSWDTEENIWDASLARKRADNYGVRSFKKGLREVMRYVKTAANSGQYECTVYNDNISADVAIDSIINTLMERGYTVKKCEQLNGWYIKISW